jgi:hypothetical protein
MWAMLLDAAQKPLMWAFIAVGLLWGERALLVCWSR